MKLCVMIAHGIVGFWDCRTCDRSINPPLPICKDLSARCTISLKHIINSIALREIFHPMS